MVANEKFKKCQLLMNWVDIPVAGITSKINNTLLDNFLKEMRRKQSKHESESAVKGLLLLKSAACIGDMFGSKFLQSIYPLRNETHKSIISLLKLLEQKDFIEILDETDPKNAICRFRKCFLRETIYQSMLYRDQKKGLHQLCSEFLENNSTSELYEPEVEAQKLLQHILIAEDLDQEDKIPFKSKQGLIVKKINNKILKGGPNAIVMSGPMTKQGNKASKKISKRLMILRAGELLWYHNENELHRNRPLGVIYLESIYQVFPGTRYKSSSDLNIGTNAWRKKDQEKEGKREFIFAAKDELERDEWISSIEYMRTRVIYDNFVNKYCNITLKNKTEDQIMSERDQYTGREFGTVFKNTVKPPQSGSPGNKRISMLTGRRKSRRTAGPGSFMTSNSSEFNDINGNFNQLNNPKDIANKIKKLYNISICNFLAKVTQNSNKQAFNPSQSDSFRKAPEIIRGSPLFHPADDNSENTSSKSVSISEENQFEGRNNRLRRVSDITRGQENMEDMSALLNQELREKSKNRQESNQIAEVNEDEDSAAENDKRKSSTKARFSQQFQMATRESRELTFHAKNGKGEDKYQPQVIPPKSQTLTEEMLRAKQLEIMNAENEQEDREMYDHRLNLLKQKGQDRPAGSPTPKSNKSTRFQKDSAQNSHHVHLSSKDLKSSPPADSEVFKQELDNHLQQQAKLETSLKLPSRAASGQMEQISLNQGREESKDDYQSRTHRAQDSRHNPESLLHRATSNQNDKYADAPPVQYSLSLVDSAITYQLQLNQENKLRSKMMPPSMTQQEINAFEKRNHLDQKMQRTSPKKKKIEITPPVDRKQNHGGDESEPEAIDLTPSNSRSPNRMEFREQPQRHDFSQNIAITQEDMNNMNTNIARSQKYQRNQQKFGDSMEPTRNTWSTNPPMVNQMQDIDGGSYPRSYTPTEIQQQQAFNYQQMMQSQAQLDQLNSSQMQPMYSGMPPYGAAPNPYFMPQMQPYSYGPNPMLQQSLSQMGLGMPPQMPHPYMIPPNPYYYDPFLSPDDYLMAPEVFGDDFRSEVEDFGKQISELSSIEENNEQSTRQKGHGTDRGKQEAIVLENVACNIKGNDFTLAEGELVEIVQVLADLGMVQVSFNNQIGLFPLNSIKIIRKNQQSSSNMGIAASSRAKDGRALQNQGLKVDTTNTKHHVKQSAHSQRDITFDQSSVRDYSGTQTNPNSQVRYSDAKHSTSNDTSQPSQHQLKMHERMMKRKQKNKSKDQT